MIEELDRPPGEADIRALAALLVDAVESGAAVSFMAPLDVDRAAGWWRDLLASADARARVFVARDGGAIVGTVQFHPAWAPNQPHRAEIVKLIVRRDARGRGTGRALMEAAEAAARRDGFTLLTLDAKRGAPAEQLYRAMGWTAAGTIPGYALDSDGTPHDAVFFYKHLERSPR